MFNYQDNISVLYVEDDEAIREGYARALSRVAQELYLATNGEEGLKLYKKYTPDIVISDIKMPVMDGLSMVSKIKEINKEANIVFTTAHSETSYLLEAIEFHVEGYLLKPVQKNTMISLIKKIKKNILLERENIAQKNILQFIIDAENSLSIITNFDSILFASKAFLDFFRMDNIEQLNRKFESVLDIVQQSDTLINKEKILIAKEKGLNFYNYIQTVEEAKRIVSLVNEEGKKHFYIHVSQMSSSNLLISLTDITKMEQEFESIQQKAYKDNLTKVYNRNKFQEIFDYELRKYKRYNSAFCVAIIDIDHFKKFNDTYGHLIGDEVLVMLAQTIRKNMRETDTFARWGGEEFVLLLSDTDLQQAVLKLEFFKDKIEQMQHKVAGNISASFGVTQVKIDDTLEKIFQRADEALYIAKESGRNCVRSK